MTCSRMLSFAALKSRQGTAPAARLLLQVSFLKISPNLHGGICLPQPDLSAVAIPHVVALCHQASRVLRTEALRNALTLPSIAVFSIECTQVSEDHCWINLDPVGACREDTVESTTDTAAKRGLPVSEAAWRGWLYSGGRATLCTPQASMDHLSVSHSMACSLTNLAGIGASVEPAQC